MLKNKTVMYNFTIISNIVNCNVDFLKDVFWFL